MRIPLSLVVLFSLLPNVANANLTIKNSFNKSYALVVGIDKYPSSKWQDLSYAVADAKAMNEFLKNQGFIVTTLYDEKATRDAIVNELEGKIGKRLGPNDRFVLFFAGHGHTEYYAGGKERGYVVPHDGKDRSATYLSMARIRDISDILGVARHQLFIMDTCYGGRLGSRGEMGHLDPKLPQYLDQVVKRKARQILTAGGATQRVLDSGSDGHSVFTGALLEALSKGYGDTNGDGVISFYELASYIQLSASRSNQSPAVDYLDGHGQGEFVFINPAWAGTQAPIKPSHSQRGLTRGKSASDLVKDAKTLFIKHAYQKATPLFQEAAELGHIEAKFYLGVILFKEGQGKKGLSLIEEAANYGNQDAMETLEHHYRTNLLDLERAKYWKNEITNAKVLTSMTRLVDPTGEAGKGDPVVPKEAVRLSPPRNLRIITY